MTAKPPPLPDRYLEPYEVVSRRDEETTQREGFTKDPRDLLISSLQQEVRTLRLIQQLPSEPPQPFEDSEELDESAPDTQPSRRAKRKQQVVSISKLLGKWAGLLTLLPFIGAFVAKQWPQLTAPVDFVLELVRRLQ